MGKAGAVILFGAATLALLGAARFGLGTRIDESERSGCVVAVSPAEST